MTKPAPVLRVDPVLNDQYGPIFVKPCEELGFVVVAPEAPNGNVDLQNMILMELEQLRQIAIAAGVRAWPR